MRGIELVAELKRKHDLTTDGEVASYLGMSQMALVHWNRQTGDLSARQIANSIEKATKAAIKKSQGNTIRPIAEFFPVNSVESRGGAKFELFPTGKDDNPLHKGLRTLLQSSKGIYIFYDTRGRAIYAGKAKKQTLWNEMKSAFNRDRETQTVYRVEHPGRRQKFIPAYEKVRQPRQKRLQLSDLAAYFSAFEIEANMIDSLEALLVRSFANDLLNARMERFPGLSITDRNS
jgi:hypothetical protein